ncbi:MAG: S-layer homology domain-containing protein [Acidimicrobiales bacterium]|nr:S-layer homology domain-containing protein [Acidimicrobiales bacterium]
MAGAILAPLLAFSQTTPAAAANEPWIDTSDRAEVLASYLAEFEREEPASGYSGDVDTCTPGTTSQAYRDSIVQRVNWYRRMAGLDTVTERASYSTATQQTSMMMSAEGSLSHSPGSGWACHTSTGATTAGMSNLALGVNGLGAIDAYIRDPGSNNHAVGHRRTVLYPQLREIGSGDVETENGHWAANTLHVFDDNLWGARPEVREARDFVAWPPAGYVPAETTWGRWSFSLYGGDFSTATVTVSDSLGAIQVNVLERIQPENPASRIAPEPSIVWAVGGDTNSTQLPEPTNGDECYTVTIGGVKVGGATQPDFMYETCLLDLDFDPSAAPSDPPGDNDNDNDGPCDGIDFDVWTVPCWADEGNTLGNFTDVTATWQREAVAWLVGNDITTGVSPTRFDPDAALTRAQAATMIWRLVGSPPPPNDAPRFDDVPAGAYYEQAVRWMARYGVTTGTSANHFSPNAPATRAEFVTFLWRLVDEPTVNAPMPFGDLTATWQVGAVRWAAHTAITTGTSSNTFAPDATVTRGQAAALLARFADAVS